MSDHAGSDDTTSEQTGERVGIVVVSHSVRIAEGVVELAGQMAPHVTVVPAGGRDDDGIGTSFQRVDAAIAHADRGAGAVVLVDLGSASMIAETVHETLDQTQQKRVLISDAALVEGSVAAAVAAEGGLDVAAVHGAAKADASLAPRDDALHVRTVVLRNPDGLHARPAAEFVKLAATFDDKVTVNGKDARSLLAILSLGLVHGSTVQISGDQDASAAVDALADLVESGFGEANRQGRP